MYFSGIHQSAKELGSRSGKFSVASMVLFILATPTGQSLGLSKYPRKFSRHLDFSDTFCVYMSNKHFLLGFRKLNKAGDLVLSDT